MWPGLTKRRCGIAAWIALLAGVLGASACTSLSYYGQAVSGHLDLMSKRRELGQVMAAEDTPPELRARLGDLASMRDFAVSDLGLPDNGSYRLYADVERPYLVWNVFAAPELSLQPKEWCFLVVGCVTYRGYFNQADANRMVAALGTEGYETWAGGVPAYSTLGWFDDPLLNTFVHWSRGRVAELMFHELAHQRLYIADDTAFNESFATAVGQLGAERWLAMFGRSDEGLAYRRERARREAFIELMSGTRQVLETTYAAAIDDAEKRARKQAALSQAQSAYADWKRRWDDFDGFDPVMATGPNNAWFVALSAYHRWVPAFRRLFELSGESLPRFYEQVQALSELDQLARDARLKALSGDAQSLLADLR
jgi:predicted aminopeptidase